MPAPDKTVVLRSETFPVIKDSCHDIRTLGNFNDFVQACIPSCYRPHRIDQTGKGHGVNGNGHEIADSQTVIDTPCFLPEGKEPYLGVIEGEWVDRFQNTERIKLAHSVSLKTHIMRRFNMVRTGRGNRKTQSHAGFSASVMKRHFLALDVECIFFSALADLFRGTFYAICQNIAQASPICNRLDQPDHGIGITEAKRSAARVRFRQNPLFEALHGKRSHRSRRNNVQPKKIAQLISPGQSRQVVVPDHGPQGRQGFIFRPAKPRVQGIRIILQCHPALALYRTGVTGAGGVKNGAMIGFRIDLVCTFEYPVSEIPGGKHPRVIEALQ